MRASDDGKMRALLGFLARGDAIFETDDRRILRLDDGTSLKRQVVNAAVLRRAIDEGHVAISRRTATLTASGRARLAMRRDGTGVNAGLAEGRSEEPPAGDPPPLVDIAESPLAWLYRRRAAGGRGFLSEAEFRAGERLRLDFTKAGLMPSVTTNWRAMAISGGGGVSRADMTDLALAARDRVQRALAMIGPDLAGVALDVCCFLKGLEQVEGERGWPQRSAKVALLLALRGLARHYGLADATSGAAATSGPKHWGAPDFRPTVGSAPP